MRTVRRFAWLAALRGFGLAIACVLLAGCGRFGVHLLPPSAATIEDAGGTDAGGYSGPGVDGGPCEGASCEPVCPDASMGASTMQSLCGCASDSAADSDGDGVPDCSDFCPNAPDQ